MKGSTRGQKQRFKSTGVDVRAAFVQHVLYDCDRMHGGVSRVVWKHKGDAKLPCMQFLHEIYTLTR